MIISPDENYSPMTPSEKIGKFLLGVGGGALNGTPGYIQKKIDRSHPES